MSHATVRLNHNTVALDDIHSGDNRRNLVVMRAPSQVDLVSHLVYPDAGNPRARRSVVNVV